MIIVGAILATSGFVDFVELYRSHHSELMWLSVSFFVVLGTMIITMGIVMLRPKGGATIDHQQQALQIFGDKPSEFAAIALADIAYLRTQTRTFGTDADAVAIYSAEVVTRTGAYIVLSESVDRDEISAYVQTAADLLKSRTTWPEPQPDQAVSPPPNLCIKADAEGTTIPFRSGIRWSLAGVLLSSGIATLFLGIVMLINVQSSPLMGFLVGPPLLVLGATLTVLVVGKSVGVETIRVDRQGIRRRIFIAGQSFGEWALTYDGAFQPYARLKPLGAKGLGIEFVSSHATYVAAVGTNRHTRPMQSQSLLNVIGLLNAAIRAQLPAADRPETIS